MQARIDRSKIGDVLDPFDAQSCSSRPSELFLGEVRRDERASTAPTAYQPNLSHTCGTIGQAPDGARDRGRPEGMFKP